MLIGKNNKKKWGLGWYSNGETIWRNLKDIEHSPIDPVRGPNAEAGICLLLSSSLDEEAVLGIYYQTASFREILQFPNKIFLLNMDDSSEFKNILEEFFKTQFEYYPNKTVNYLYFTICRDVIPETPSPFTSTDYKRNIFVHSIFQTIVEKWPEEIKIPAKILPLDNSIEDAHEFHEYTTKKEKIKILQKIDNFLKNN